MAKMFGELAMFSGRSNRPLAEAICKHLHIPLAEAQIIDFFKTYGDLTFF